MPAHSNRVCIHLLYCLLGTLIELTFQRYEPFRIYVADVQQRRLESTVLHLCFLHARMGGERPRVCRRRACSISGRGPTEAHAAGPLAADSAAQARPPGPIDGCISSCHPSSFKVVVQTCAGPCITGSTPGRRPRHPRLVALRALGLKVSGARTGGSRWWVTVP